MSAAIWVVVPAAGRGARFGAPLPKQYLQAGGQILLAARPLLSCRAGR